MAENQTQLLQEFCAITGVDSGVGRHFLEASNWNLEVATEQYFLNEEMEAREEEDDDAELYAKPGASGPQPPPAASPAGSSSAKPKAKTQSRASAKVRTLGDLSSRGDSPEDEDESTKKRDLFAGGEKSGLAVQDPGDPSASGHGHLVQDILKRAAEGGRSRQNEDQVTAAPSSRFSGSGHTLGSDTAESVTIPDPQAVAAPAATRQSVTRTLTFWRNGFSVEDGPLMRYEDPANQEILQAIESGRAPLSLMNVLPGQPADVNVFKRMDEDYVAPKKKFAPFSGQGQRLGSVTPGEPIHPPAPAAPATGAAPAAAPPPSVSVDSSAPTTTLQIRLSDGTRLVSRFNHSHTVGDLYGFVRASNPESRTRSYILQTTFPNKELKDMAQTIKDAGLINAVVVQKRLS